MSAPAPVVRAIDLAAGYGRRAVWSGATFDIEPGEFVAVLGPNGAGKSTLLRLLLGQADPLGGHVELFGRPPRSGNAAIGYVPQARPVDPDVAMRGVDLVGLGADGHRWGMAVGRAERRDRAARVAVAIEAVGAERYAHRRVGLVSGGERQRLWLAQALVGDPSLLLLDEPLAGLDLRSQGAVAELVAALVRERSLAALLVAHDVNPLLPHVDRVLYVANGSVAIGAPAEVVNSETLSRLYDAPVEVLTDRRGRIFVVGLGEETAHPHDHEDGAGPHGAGPHGAGPHSADHGEGHR